jgi:hypothetical protein
MLAGAVLAVALAAPSHADAALSATRAPVTARPGVVQGAVNRARGSVAPVHAATARVGGAARSVVRSATASVRVVRRVSRPVSIAVRGVRRAVSHVAGPVLAPTPSRGAGRRTTRRTGHASARRHRLHARRSARRRARADRVRRNAQPGAAVRAHRSPATRPGRGGAQPAAGRRDIGGADSASGTAPAPAPGQPSSAGSSDGSATPAAALPAALLTPILGARRRLRPAARTARSADRLFRLERPG